MVKMKKNEDACECTRTKVGEIFEIECNLKGETKKIINCILETKGKSGGVSLLGFGADYGEQKTSLTCFSDDDFKEEVAKKLGIKKEEIKWAESPGKVSSKKK